MKKNKTLKVLLTSLIAACSLLFAVGCGKLFGPSDPNGKTSAGKGTFSLRIGGTNAQSRTIMPDNPLSQVVGYTLKFTNTVTSVAQAPIYRTKTQVSESVNLEVGTYNLEVTAYTSYTDETTNTPVAKGNAVNPNNSSDQIDINKGGTTFGIVYLEAITAGQGTFTWEIGLPALDTASMTITPLPGGSPTTYNLLGAASPDNKEGSCSLNSGEYSVVFTLTKDATTKPVIWRETLHIYQNMTSDFKHTFTDDYFIKNSFTVSLYHGGVGGELILSKTWFYDEDYTPNNPNNPGYDFGGWYEDTACTTTPYSFGPPLPELTGDLKLYAKWKQDAATANTSINSNDLLTVSGSSGWYAKDVSGTWLEGYMVQTGEKKELDISLTEVRYSFNQFQQQKADSGVLDGGVGAWSWKCDTNGNPAEVVVTVDIFIPYDSLDVWFEQEDNPANQIRKGNNSLKPNVYEISATGSTFFILKIKLNASSAWEYKDDSFEPHYPIFRQGSGGSAIYYWQQGGDMWSIFGESVQIIEFPIDNHGELGSIVIRAWDVSEPGVYFYPSLSGSDTALTALITNSDYKSPVSYDLKIDGVKVGEIMVKIKSHVQGGSPDYILSKVTLEIEYDLDTAFADTVESFTCGGITVPGTNIVEIEKNHGPITLTTEFTFK